MSSILDALNKVAAEKASAHDEVVDPRAAAEEMVGAPASRALTLTPRVIAGAAAAAVLLVALSVGLSAVLLRGETSSANVTTVSPPDQMQLARTAQEATPTMSPAAPVTSPPAQPDAAPAQPATPTSKSTGTWRDVIASDASTPPPIDIPRQPNPEPVQVATTKTPGPDLVNVPVPAESHFEPDLPAQAQEQPSAITDTGTTTTPLPTFEQIRAERLKTRAVESSELSANSKTSAEDEAPVADQPSSDSTTNVDDLSSAALPELSRATRDRYDLKDLTINMTRPSSATNPRAIAFINRYKVYENERVLTTRTRLLKVFSDGVAIEVIGSNERYFVPIGAPR